MINLSKIFGRSAALTIDELLYDYKIFKMSEVEKGERFERLMRNFFGKTRTQGERAQFAALHLRFSVEFDNSELKDA